MASWPPPVNAASEAPAEAEEDAVESAFAEQEAGDEAATLEPAPESERSRRTDLVALNL
jgi:hypothetical protein